MITDRIQVKYHRNLNPLMAISICPDKNGLETAPLVGRLENPVRENGSPEAKQLNASVKQNKKRKHAQKIENGTQTENRKTVFGRIARTGAVT